MEILQSEKSFRAYSGKRVRQLFVFFTNTVRTVIDAPITNNQ